MNIEKLYFELKVRRLILGCTSCYVCLCYCVSVSAASTHLELHQWTCGTLVKRARNLKLRSGFLHFLPRTLMLIVHAAMFLAPLAD